MATQPVIAWKPLGELLVERGLLTVAQLDDALEEQGRTGERLGTILVRRRIVAGAVLTALLAEQVGVELETQGGFGSGLFSKMARRDRVPQPARVDVAQARAENRTPVRGASAHDDPAFELSALRAEVEMLRMRTVQLEAELADLKARKPTSRRRAEAKTSAGSYPPETASRKRSSTPGQPES